MEILEYQGVAPCYYDHTRDLRKLFRAHPSLGRVFFFFTFLL